MSISSIRRPLTPEYLSVSQYKYVVVDEFGGVMRKFVSKTEAQPYLTEGTKLVKLPPTPVVNPFTFAFQILGESLW